MQIIPQKKKKTNANYLFNQRKKYIVFTKRTIYNEDMIKFKTKIYNITFIYVVVFLMTNVHIAPLKKC